MLRLLIGNRAMSPSKSRGGRLPRRWTILGSLDVLSDPGGIGQCLEERVARQPVGPVQAGRGDLAAGPEPLNRTAAVIVHLDPAHVVMGCRPYRNRLTHWIEAGGPAQRRHAREFPGDPLSQNISSVEEDAFARTDLGEDRPCHHIARRQLGFGNVFHEPLAAAVDEHGSFAPQGFRGQRHRIEARRDGCRMELNELEIAQDSPCTGCERQPATLGAQRVGGVRVEPADPACRQHHGPARDQDRFIAALRSPRDVDHTGHGAVPVECQIDDAVVLQDLNGRSLPDGMDKGVQNTPAGSIPIRVNDPPARVRGFQPQDQAIPGRGSIKTGAMSDQPFDAGRGGGRHTGGNIRIAEARTRLKGIGGVQGRVVVRPESRRDPALRQRRGGVLPQW